MRIGLPEAVTPAIESLCAELVQDGRPQFVNVTPAAGATPDNCFVEVAKQIQVHGGSACHGWSIWETPFVMLEAEAHSLWRDDAGELHDITPKRLNFDSVLFLPDPSFVYSERQVASVFRQLSEAGGTLIAIQSQKFEFMNRGARADQHGELPLISDEAEEWSGILAREKAASLLAFKYAVDQGLPLEELLKLRR